MRSNVSLGSHLRVFSQYFFKISVVPDICERGFSEGRCGLELSVTCYVKKLPKIAQTCPTAMKLLSKKTVKVPTYFSYTSDSTTDKALRSAS